MNADNFRADFLPPIEDLVDGTEVRVRVRSTNTIALPLFQADALPYLEIRKKGSKPLVAGDICGTPAAAATPGTPATTDAFHDILLRLVNAPELTDAHWELVNPANVVTTQDLQAFREGAVAFDIASGMNTVLNTARSVSYVDTQIANCSGNIPNGNCLNDPMWTPQAGQIWANWGFPSLKHANPSAFDFKGGITVTNAAITSVARGTLGLYTVTDSKVRGDVFTRTVQNCTVGPLNCVTNCNCNCDCACNCTCLCL